MSTPTDYFQKFMRELAVTHQRAVQLYKYLLQNCKDQKFSYFYLKEPFAKIEYIDKKTDQKETLPVSNSSIYNKNDIDVLINHFFFLQIQTHKNPVKNGMEVYYRIRDQQELNEYIDSIT